MAKADRIYVADVHQVLRGGIHKWVNQIRDGQLIGTEMPAPDFVEIHVSPQDAMLYRYRHDGTFCGDTWHEDLDAAKGQALYEYGTSEDSWRLK